jgi:putative serine protease PepD
VPPSLLDDPVRPSPSTEQVHSRAAAPPPSPPREPRALRGRRGLAVVVVVSSLLGGAAASGVLLATGVVGDDSPAVATSVGTDTGSDVTPIVSSASGSGLNAAALYAKASPGVVDITATGTAGAAEQQSPFGDQGAAPQSTATGTGFVTGTDGHIITAAHVVDGASSITVAFQDGTKRTAKLTGKDDATDVALLKVDPAGLTLHPLTLGSSASLRAGDALAVIGDPFGYERSISTGIVSGLDRTIQAPNGFTVAHAIQTDAAMNPGNSGGPILNAAGQVIGIADQIATGGSTRANAGVGFAVPIDLVKSDLPALKAGQTPRHAYLGVSMAGADGSAGGALVGAVSSGGPAADAGLRTGDTITAIDGTKVADSNALISVIAAKDPGDKVTLTVRRGSDSSQHTVTLATQPSTAQAASGTP